MSREFNYDGYWEGETVYQCDCCNVHHSFPFTNEEEAKNSKVHRAQLRKDCGWITTQVNGFWHDFCSEECRNKYIRANTL